MSLVIPKDLRERIIISRLCEFLKKHKLTMNGQKVHLWQRIEGAVNGSNPNTTLTIEELDEFIAEEISHGKNRILFVSSFTATDGEILKKLSFIQTSMENKGFPIEKFNHLRSITLPEKTTLAYFDYTLQGDDVSKISFCFAKSIILEKESTLIKGERSKKDVTDYIWIDILPFEQRFIIKTGVNSNLYFENQSNQKEIYDEFSSLIRDVFSLSPRNVGEVKQYLYKMFNELTHTAEQPFREKMNPALPSIKSFVDECVKTIGVKPEKLSIDIPHRIYRLLERVLIQQDLDLYKHYFEGKRGYVERIAFSDPTGAHVNARSASDKGIEVADIYFDTRDTLEQLQIIDKLWASWFYKPNPQKAVETIPTKFEVFKEYYIIHFLHKYITKEVEQLVLSNFKYFEELHRGG